MHTVLKVLGILLLIFATSFVTLLGWLATKGIVTAKIIQELQMIRMLLQKQVDGKASINAPDQVKIGSPEKKLASLGKNIIGNDSAPLTLVEFVDLQCPFCIQFHNDVLPELRRKYI